MYNWLSAFLILIGATALSCGSGGSSGDGGTGGTADARGGVNAILSCDIPAAGILPRSCTDYTGTAWTSSPQQIQGVENGCTSSISAGVVSTVSSCPTAIQVAECIYDKGSATEYVEHSYPPTTIDQAKSACQGSFN